MTKSWFRLLTLQGSWNHDRLQGVGAAVATEPLLRDQPGGPKGSAYRNGVQRAAGYFNTHPYFAGLAIGAVARAECEGEDGVHIERLRSALKGPLGSVGDRLVWAGALPVASSLGLVTATLWSPLAGVIAFLVAFNVVHLAIRLWALPTGWRLGTSVVHALSAPILNFGLRIAGPAATVSIGFAIPVLGFRLVDGLAMEARAGVLIVAAAAFVVLRWLVPTLGASRVGLLAVSLALLWGWIWP